MDELRNAIGALADDAQMIEAAVATGEDVPSKARLAEFNGALIASSKT